MVSETTKIEIIYLIDIDNSNMNSKIITGIQADTVEDGHILLE